LPGHGSHVGLFRGTKLQEIGAPVGIDHEIRGDIRSGWLDQDVDALGGTGPAFGIADDPAYGVAGRDRSGAYELLAFLQSDVSHLPRRGVDLIECA
jgi:hypothetical protein